MAVLKHSANSVVFDDSISKIGSNKIDTAVKKLDERLDLLENTSIVSNSGNLTAVGWKDNIIPIIPSRSNASDSPLWTDIGNGIEACVFADSKTQSNTIHFHINHDYMINTPIYPHIHWLPLSKSTGNVVWQLSYRYAKAFGQGQTLTGTLTNITLIQNANGIIGEHLTTEVDDLNTINDISEPDVVLVMSLKRLGSDVRDTFTGSAAALFVDLHYQSDMDHTPNKRPNFRAIGA